MRPPNGLALTAVMALCVSCRTAPSTRSSTLEQAASIPAADVQLSDAVDDALSPVDGVSVAEATPGSCRLVSHEPVVVVDVDPAVGDETPAYIEPPVAAPSSLDLDAQVFSLADLEGIAAVNNPTLRQAAALTDAARGVHYQAGRLPNPTLGYLGQEIGNQGTAGMQGGYVSQTIVLGHKLERNVAVADQRVQLLQWQMEAQRFKVRNDVRRQYYETLGAQRRVELTSDLERIARDGVDTARALEDALQGSHADVLQSEIQWNEVVVLHETAEVASRASLQRLAAVIGCPQLTIGQLNGNLEDDGPERSFELARQQLLTASPSLQEAQAQVRQARAMIDRQEAQPIPNLQAIVGGMHNNANDQNGAMVNLGLPLPVFNDNRGNVQRAVADYHAACANLERLTLQLQAQLAETFGQYEQSRIRVQVFRDRILPRESESLALIEQAYPAQFDFLRVLSARRSYFEAQLRYLDALVELRKTEVALDGLLLIGGLEEPRNPAFDENLRRQALSGQ